MKKYLKPEVDVIVLRAEEQIATANSGNNGWGNGDQSAPGNSLPNNNAENKQDGKSNNGNGKGKDNGKK